MFKKKAKSRITHVLSLCLLGFLLGTGIAWQQVNKEMDVASDLAQLAPASGEEVADEAPLPSYEGADIGGAFTLVNQDGNPVTDQDFSGQYKLIYFGFTFCPMICPTELQKVKGAMKILEAESDAEEAAMITPIFITTDPERDTPEVMKNYVSLFHPRMVGLTGSLEQVAAVQQTYKVYSAKAEDPELSDYTMNHSSFTYFMGPNDELLALFKTDDTPEMIANTVRRILGSS